MTWIVKTFRTFDKQIKRLVKKYRSIPDDFEKLVLQLSANPFAGTLVLEHIHKVYKIRMQIKSKSRGKSGGARVIYYTVTDRQTIKLIAIYDKSEKANIADAEIIELIELSEYEEN